MTANKIMKIGSGETPAVADNWAVMTIEEIGALDRELIEEFFDVARMALWDWNPSKDILRGTRQLYEMMGFRPGDYGGSLFSCLDSLIQRDDMDSVRSTLAKAIESGGIERYQFRILRTDGQERWLTVKARANAEKQRVFGVMFDITEAVRDQEQARRLALMKEAMLEVSHSIINLKDSKSLLEILLDKAMMLIPTSCAGSVLIVGEDGYLHMLASRGYDSEGSESFLMKIEDSFTYRVSGGLFEEPFIVNHIKELVKDGCMKPLKLLDGREIDSNLSTPIRLDGDPVALVIVDSVEDQVFTGEDIELMGYLKSQAELVLMNLKLYQDTLRMSRYDHLTEVFNRGYFDRIFEALIEEAPRSFSFIIMDLDGLKAVNDQHGHREGDLSLKTFVSTIRKALDPEDILGRYGGDEFVAIMPAASREMAENRIAAVVSLLDSAPEPACSFSYGVAEYPTDGASLVELVRISDKRLYEHKRSKKFSRRCDDRGNQNQ